MAASLQLPNLTPPPPPSAVKVEDLTRPVAPETPAGFPVMPAPIQAAPAVPGVAPVVVGPLSPIGVPVYAPGAQAPTAAGAPATAAAVPQAPPAWVPAGFRPIPHVGGGIRQVLFYANRGGSPASVATPRAAMIIGESQAEGHVNLMVFADPTFDQQMPMRPEMHVPLVRSIDPGDIPLGARVAAYLGKLNDLDGQFDQFAKQLTFVPGQKPSKTGTAAFLKSMANGQVASLPSAKRMGLNRLPVEAMKDPKAKKKAKKKPAKAKAGTFGDPHNPPLTTQLSPPVFPGPPKPTRVRTPRTPSAA